jgi:riboflavin biosynthesis pyrimidine reductase
MEGYGVPSDHPVLRLYPPPAEEIPVCGLYLQREPTLPGDRARPWVYSNFIVSLDGRIAIDQPHRRKQGVPDTITNPRDWRLFQELAAQADALITSDRYLRELADGTAQAPVPVSWAPEYQDLLAWRKARGLAAQPALVVLSAGLHLPPNGLFSSLARPVYVAVGQDKQSEAKRRFAATEVRILLCGAGSRVQGKVLIETLGKEGFRSIYAIGGTEVLETLVKDGMLDRLYLTHAHRVLGGHSYRTLWEGELLHPPLDVTLRALYYDQHGGEGLRQSFAIYDVL